MFHVDFQILGFTRCGRFQRCEVRLLYNFCEFFTFLTGELTFDEKVICFQMTFYVDCCVLLFRPSLLTRISKMQNLRRHSPSLMKEQLV